MAMEKIEAAILALNACEEADYSGKMIDLLEAVRETMNNEEKFVVPVETLMVKKSSQIAVQTVEMDNGDNAFAAFTSLDEAEKGEDTAAVEMKVDVLLERALKSDAVMGVTLNPWGEACFIPKDYIQMIFNANQAAKENPQAKPGNFICFECCDITTLETEAIVNAANKSLLGGGGVDGAIHRAAGPELLAECRTLGGCETGEAKMTKGYQLKAKYVIHTVGPIYSGVEEDIIHLCNCYWNSLELARKNEIHSIAFPAISTGVYGYPLKEATAIALSTVAKWFQANPEYGMTVVMACFDESTRELYKAMWNR